MVSRCRSAKEKYCYLRRRASIIPKWVNSWASRPIPSPVMSKKYIASWRCIRAAKRYLKPTEWGSSGRYRMGLRHFVAALLTLTAHVLLGSPAAYAQAESPVEAGVIEISEAEFIHTGELT